MKRFGRCFALVEALTYMKLLGGQPKHRAFTYGIAANVVSYVVGLFTVGALHTGIMLVMERIF